MQKFSQGVIAAVIVGSLLGSATGAHAQSKADLTGIKTYLLTKTAELAEATAAIQQATDPYYDLAKAANFDYNALWTAQAKPVATSLEAAKQAWIVASPLYEQMEGIVAGVPSLADYDVILDAGSSAESDPANAVPFDLKLPDGRVLPKPGNLFGVLETALWGTVPSYVGKADVDLDNDGKISFGEALPEANVVKAAADLMHSYALELDEAAKKWEPTETDAFTALVVMLPTMSEYFESWKQSRFVAGKSTTQSDFNVISRLADIEDILSGLEVVYKGVSPLLKGVDPARDAQIGAGIADLIKYVKELRDEEKNGKIFTAEEADLLGSEAQDRASAIAGQIAQVAAQLKIQLPE